MTKAALNMSLSEIQKAAVDEAIERLSLVSPDAGNVILRMLVDGGGVPPRALCTAYRKSGDQLSRDELKGLGLRSNAFLSRLAFQELTDEGKLDPLKAHEQTLLRAFFTVSRWSGLVNSAKMLDQTGIKPSAVTFKYDMLPPMCEACHNLDGEIVTRAEAAIFPPLDCQCETANYAIKMRIDWLAGIV